MSRNYTLVIYWLRRIFFIKCNVESIVMDWEWDDSSIYGLNSKTTTENLNYSTILYVKISKPWV